MPGNQFTPKRFEDFEILDEAGGKVGDIRVKPSGVLWSPKGAHSWFKVDLDKFRDWMEKNGTKQKK